jgi:predicted metal-dependent peptidase
MKVILDKIVKIEKVKTNEKFMDLQTEIGNYIANNIITHNSRPSKRSESTGVYMPFQLKENIDIVVAIDSSGSISDEDMTDFMSEMIGISKSFSAIRMTVLVCDAKIQSVQEITNGFSPKDIKLAGFGGTSFKPVFSWISENKPSAKLLVYFTDGYGDFPSSETIKTLWVLPNDNKVPFGEKIVYKGEQ